MNWLRISLFLLLAVGVVCAQDATTQQPPAASQPSASSQTDVGQPTDTNEPLLKGCVSGSKDNYILTDQTGQTYRLHSDKDISEHVGNTVEVRGTMKKEGADKPAAASASAAAAPQEIDVADIKSVSKGCSASGMEQPKQ